MAVTKTHPIKSTLKAAIDYICNPEKTDGKLLVSSYGCAAETADIEFAWTRRHAIDKGTNLGRHLIQAFQPGEVTPEQAHEIGMELAKEILGGKYEFVLHYRRRDRWFRPGMAADRGGVVCAADGVPADCWMIFLRHGNMENCRSCRWKSHSQPDGKRQAFSHRSANSFPTASQSWQFTHIPTTPTTAAIHPFLSNPNEKILWKFLFNGGTICTPVQTTEPC